MRWSDGSLSMHLGNEVFDVFKMEVAGEQNHLFVQQVCPKHFSTSFLTLLLLLSISNVILFISRAVTFGRGRGVGSY